VVHPTDAGEKTGTKNTGKSKGSWGPAEGFKRGERPGKGLHSQLGKSRELKSTNIVPSWNRGGEGVPAGGEITDNTLRFPIRLKGVRNGEESTMTGGEKGSSKRTSENKEKRKKISSPPDSHS